MSPRRTKPFRIEGVEHELNLLGCTAAQYRQHGIDLVIEQRHNDEIIGKSLIQRIADAHSSMLPLFVDDPPVALQLLQPKRTRAGDGRYVVVTDTRQMECKRAANATYTDDSDLQRLE